YISASILFEETLRKKMVDCLKEQDIVPDRLALRSAEYYSQGACFTKWRTVVSIPCGPSTLAVKEAAWGLARYAAISQDNDLVPIVEPDILLDGDPSIDTTLEVAEKVWS
ncbi:fructose-bisphosphate aldolase 3, chloroplastic, partial [Tanacetum coccineum]